MSVSRLEPPPNSDTESRGYRGSGTRPERDGVRHGRRPTWVVAVPITAPTEKDDLVLRCLSYTNNGVSVLGVPDHQRYPG